ncbi:MAG TPA: ADOP family duplicated permease [Thermoanaerobaculia bacterium]|nr:ADOP family duplicated permease [Thermoanaerobaculia bacterium]
MSALPESLAARCFRLALSVLPRPLRRRHGAEAMRLFFDLETRARERRGAVGAWLLLVRSVFDLARQAPGAHRFEARRLSHLDRRPRGLAMSTLRHDLVLAARLLGRQPIFTTVAALTLALGLGANAAIFSAVYGVLLRPLAVRDADRLALVVLHRASDRNDVSGFHPHHLEDLRARIAGRDEIEGMAAFLYESTTLMEDGRAEEIGSVVHAGPDFFRVVGYQPLLGRGLLPADALEDRVGDVAVIDETLWRDRFGADPAIVGRTVVLDKQPVIVVGVLPAAAPIPERGHRIWMPRGWDREDPTLIGRLNLLARVGDGGPQAAQEALRHAFAEIEPDHPRLAGYTATLLDFRESLVGEVRPALLLTSGAVGLILLIACANLASLLLARASARDREMATRRAIGARLPQLLHQVLVESLLLSALGGVLAVGFAIALHRLLILLAPAALPRLEAIRLDLPVLAFVGALTLVSGVAFGLAPIAHVIGIDGKRGAAGAPRADRRRGGRLRAAMVVGQVAVATALLVGAALLLRSLSEASAVDPGFDAAGVGGARIYLDSADYSGDAEELSYFRQLLERLEGRSDLRAAGASSGLPMDPQTIDYDLPFTLPGESANEDLRQAFFRIISPGFLETLRVPLLEGRLFDDRDASGSEPVALINRSFARLAWPDRSPVGESFLIYSGRRELRVVGVVGDVRFSGLTASHKPEFYVPYTQITYGAMTVVARGLDPDLAARAIAEEALAVDSAQPVHTTFSLSRLTADSIATHRFLAVLLTAFAAVSLLLSMAGIYGVLSQWVGESARELGVRVALGSSRRGIVRLVLARTARLGAAGLAIGLAACLALGSLIRGFLFGIEPTDPLSLAAAAGVLAITVLAAGLRPALRASARPPMDALRAE